MVEKINNLNFVERLVFKIAEIGNERKIIDTPRLHNMEVFKYFFDKNGKLKTDELDTMDGAWTRKVKISYSVIFLLNHISGFKPILTIDFRTGLSFMNIATGEDTL